MPEGPEVQTIVNGLKAVLANDTIVEVIFADPRLSVVRPVPAQKFIDMVRGASILDVRRRGKFIEVEMTSGLHLIIHLIMTGQLIVGAPDEKPRFWRASFLFNSGKALHLADRSGWVRIVPVSKAEIPTFLPYRELGLDIFSDAFNLANFSAILTSRRPIHATLLDQGLISGLGNIYVNESLWHAGIHPTRPTNSMSPQETEALYRAIRTVTSEALKHKGTTFSDYRTPDGGRGEYQHHLKVFKRAGKPCAKCGAPIVRARIGGRGVFYCPYDQPIDPAKRQPKPTKQLSIKLKER